MTADPNDDDITDSVASEVARRIRESHPDSTPESRRRLVSAYTRRTLGLPLTLADVGAIIGESPQRVSEIERRALARALHVYRTRFPHLLES